ncbi:MAG: hypothetical protein PHE53_07675, partial [Thermoguttaceae bacterium]|nr:hypothetical protein [Thermoguttaceae bacterium]
QADGTQWYAVTIREVYQDSAITRRIHFYVVNENETDERAYWKDATPTATLAPPLATPTYKMITFRTILNAMGLETYTPMRLRLAAAAEQSLVLSDVVNMLETYGPDGGIDINAASTQAMILSLVTTGVLTQAEADAVIALAD